MKRWVAASLCLAVTLPISSRAHAIVWPDVAERVARDLGAADAATRLTAARAIASLGTARGVPLALAALEDDDVDVRIAAADAAIRLRAVDATPAVVGWLNAPNARLRREACFVARALPNDLAVGALARTLGDPDAEVRMAAAEALGRQTAPEGVPPLLGRLDDPSPAVRVAIIGALARRGDPRAVVPLVGKAEDSSADVRQSVARTLGQLGDPRASAIIVLALRDQSIDVRREALVALGRLHASDAVDAAAPFVADRAVALRVAAAEALGAIASPAAVRVLVAALGEGDDATAGLEATPVREALVAAGVAAVGPLRMLLEASPPPATAAGAAWVLGELGAHGEAATLVSAMRRGALPSAPGLHALAGAGTAADVPVALEFLTDASPAVRSAALGAALALLDPHVPDGRAVEPLVAALRDPRPTAQERVRLATLLGRTGAPRAAPVLAALVRAGDAPMKVAAIDALANLGPAGADDALLAALDSSDVESEVRLHAAVSLSEAGGPRARDALLAELAGDREVDRQALLTALGGTLARSPTSQAVAALTHALDLASGAERDAILEALGQTALPAAAGVLRNVAHSPDVADRRSVASLCAARTDDPVSTATARALLADADATVQAEAAWSLGTIGDAVDIAPLVAIAATPGFDEATNAAASIGRIAARARRPDVAASALCPLAVDPRPFVRANALAGLALGAARCHNGALERKALSEDPSEEVRGAAAMAIQRTPTTSDEDARALQRCARTDVSGSVAARCRHRPVSAGLGAITRPVRVYIVPDTGPTPRPFAAYALLMADGTLHAGVADRRGAVFEPRATAGMIRRVLPPRR